RSPSQKTVAPAKTNERTGDQSGNSVEPPYPAKMALRFVTTPRVAGQIAQKAADQSDVSDSTSSKQSRRGTAQSTTKATPKYEDDASIVLDSQEQALEQAKESLEKQRDPQSAGLWQKAVTEMESALARLQKATNSPTALKDALSAEQSAYQALLQLQAHEYQVSRSQNRGQNSSRNQQMQRQLDELDLTDNENRYENQREAQREQNPERREQLQIMSRLQELARRQQ